MVCTESAYIHGSLVGGYVSISRGISPLLIVLEEVLKRTEMSLQFSKGLGWSFLLLHSTGGHMVEYTRSAVESIAW